MSNKAGSDIDTHLFMAATWSILFLTAINSMILFVTTTTRQALNPLNNFMKNGTICYLIYGQRDN